MRTIIIIAGLPGSGKTEASSYIRERSIPVFIMGDIIRDEMKKRGLEFNNLNSERVSLEIRKEHGKEYTARRTVENIEKSGDELVCVDGCRDMHELRYFSKAGQVVLLIVQAPEKIRYSRRIKASGYKRPKNFKEFVWRTEEERNRGIGDLMDTKGFEKHTILNNGTKEDLYRKIDRLLEKIKNSK
jgi:dephospho-CoA kinase